MCSVSLVPSHVSKGQLSPCFYLQPPCMPLPIRLSRSPRSVRPETPEHLYGGLATEPLREGSHFRHPQSNAFRRTRPETHVDNSTDFDPFSPTYPATPYIGTIQLANHVESIFRVDGPFHTSSCQTLDFGKVGSFTNGDQQGLFTHFEFALICL